MDKLVTIADQFKPQGQLVSIQAFGNGNINDTFLVTLDSPAEKRFVLQRINTEVFRQPQLVMQNMCIFTQHVRDRLQRFPLDSGRRWEVPRVLLTQNGCDRWIDPDGSCWRAISFIENSQCFDTIQSLEHAQEVGYALGMFHNLMSDLPPNRLADTLEGFHITPSYLQHYERVLAKNQIGDSPEIKYCRQFIQERQAWARVLEDAKVAGKLPLRLMHGDPKINNVTIDSTTQQAIGMIDLDTVKPGLVHYDIGDCLRSGCNPLGEETQDCDLVRFEPDLAKAVLQGYLAVAREFLTQNDCEYLYDAIRLIAFELGLRFFTDYLDGNVYFKVAYPEHNLCRAIVQFKLTESIEAQEQAIRNIVCDLQ